MIRVKNLRVPYDFVRSPAEIAAERLKISPCAVRGVIVVHKALDARRRHGAPLVWVYVLDADVENEHAVLSRFRRDKEVMPAPSEEPLMTGSASSRRGRIWSRGDLCRVAACACGTLSACS